MTSERKQEREKRVKIALEESLKRYKENNYEFINPSKHRSLREMLEIDITDGCAIDDMLYELQCPEED